MQRRVLLRGGHVYSPTYPAATALAIEDGRLSWIGRNEGAAAYADGADLVVELDGCLVTPAFVDGHVHLSQTGMAARALDLTGARSGQEVLDAVAERARRTRAGEEGVLIGFGWDESRWSAANTINAANTTSPEAPAPLPSAEQLDRAAYGQAVYLSRVDVHSALVSATLVRRVPELADTDGWDGRGRVERDAHHRVRDAVFTGLDRSERSAAVHAALDIAAASGVGCVHEMSAPHVNPSDDLALVADLAGPIDPSDPTDPAWGRLAPSVVAYWGEHAAEDGVRRAQALGCVGAAGDLCADGAFGSRSAALTAPYADQPEYGGHLYLDAAAVADHVVACTRAGVQAGFHCIGDAATAAIAEGFVRAEAEVGHGALVTARHRLEHAELMSASTVRTLRHYGVALSVQPAFDAYWGGEEQMYAARLGATRACRTNPLADLASASVPLMFGSDSPVTPIDPWGGVRAAAYHHVAAQRLSFPAAFAAHTAGGWGGVRRPESWGQLVVGTPVRLAIWRCVPAAFAPEPDGPVSLPNLAPDFPLPECAGTVVGTQPAYRNPQLCEGLATW